jgi:hypothetical protein
VAIGALGCFERRLSPVNPCNRAVFDTRISVDNVDEVDLLLMIDNSNSMAGEQTLLGRELPRMIRVLASGDTDEDGAQDFTPVRSLHVGIVTSDMGAGPAVPAGETVPSCDNGLGDDGILRTIGNTATTGCAASYPAIFDFMPPEDPVAFATDVACVAVMGTGGCGFEQQLEATLKAVAASSPSADYVPMGYVPPVFAGGTPGHGDNANVGFIRRNSALALMLVTDEEDCSVPDYSIFYRDARFTSVGLNLRCYTFAADWLYPTQRYVDNFMALRSNPALLVFAGIVGIPTTVAGSTGSAYEAMLAHPDMMERPDTSAPPGVVQHGRRRRGLPAATHRRGRARPRCSRRGHHDPVDLLGGLPPRRRPHHRAHRRRARRRVPAAPAQPGRGRDRRVRRARAPAARGLRPDHDL